MTNEDRHERPSTRRLPKEARRRQLLDTARRIVREEGTDRLTLGHLAAQAGVSKPVVYDHFVTQSVLLIELYRWIDTERVDAFREAMEADRRGISETVDLLATAYISCAADTDGEFNAVGGALAGSEEKDAVFQELLAHSVAMFVTVLEPHSRMSPAALHRASVGLVGAGEALAASSVRGKITQREAIETFASLIAGALRAP